MKTNVLSMVLLLGACAGQSALASPFNPADILGWPRANANQFGCYLEKEFGFKDRKFHCGAKRLTNFGDPCKAASAYTAGPAFPVRMASHIHPSIELVDLEWEHGELRSVNLKFKSKLSKDEIKRIFTLPKASAYPKGHPNIMSIDIQDCSKDGNCLIISGFEHMGGADVECGDEA